MKQVQMSVAFYSNRSACDLQGSPTLQYQASKASSGNVGMDGFTSFGTLMRGETACTNSSTLAHGDTNRRAKARVQRAIAIDSCAARRNVGLSRWARSSYPTRAPQHNTARGSTPYADAPLFLLFLPSSTVPSQLATPMHVWRHRC